MLALRPVIRKSFVYNWLSLEEREKYFHSFFSLSLILIRCLTFSTVLITISYLHYNNKSIEKVDLKVLNLCEAKIFKKKKNLIRTVQ